MMTYKLNGFAACYPGMRWTGLSDGKRKGLRRIGEYIDAYGTMDFMVQFHIGGRGGCRARRLRQRSGRDSFAGNNRRNSHSVKGRAPHDLL